jgi:hypothetical protein
LEVALFRGFSDCHLPWELIIDRVMKFLLPPSFLRYLATLALLQPLMASVSFSARSDFDPRFTSIEEEASPDPVLRFTYRLWPTVKVTSTEVSVDGQPLEARVSAFADNPLNTSALLALVDTSVGTSRSPRDRTVQANKEVLMDLLGKVQPRTLFGLYTFANDMVEVAPLGTPPSEIRKLVPGLKADGMGTRLYRRAMDAVAKLEGVKADRKALLIFSDGKDEDTGYTLDNLEEAAKKAGVMVMAVGCPESAQDIPALGNLERLAADSLGYYAQMQLPAGGKPGTNPPGLADAILESLDSGGEVVTSLKEVDPSAKVVVTLTTAGGQTLEQVLQRVPPPTPTPEPTPDPAESPTPDPAESPTPDAAESPTPDPAESPTPDPTPTPSQIDVATGWARQNIGWVIAGAVALLGLVVVVIAALATRKKEVPPEPIPVDPMPEPEEPEQPDVTGAQNASLAYLVMQDAGASRMSITQTATRIGRRGDNDIVFSNDSVSGHHAEIHMSREGSFTITDLGSGNGVIVNGNRVAQSGLREGDLIELGEVRFRFTLTR